jgi:cell division transport system permease protein
MKLVGATNWFIRVPFIVEGVVQALIGAVIAVLSMTFVIRPFIDELSKDRVLPIFQGFEVTDGNLLFTNVLVLAGAAAIGAIGSAVAVSRFLDV